MVASLIALESNASNPIDFVEDAAVQQDWPVERVGDDELTLGVTGKWCDYHLTFTWRSDLEALHLSAAFDLKVARDKRGEIYVLLGLINEQLWLGHFDLWSDEGLLLFRHGLPLQGGARVTREQCEALIQLAIETCERYYPAFQFVMWAGKKADEALSSAMIDCVGQA